MKRQQHNMQTITITGNVGKDAEIRRAGNDNVCSFSVGVQQGWGDKKSTNWFRCNLWGKRGEALHPYLLKGTKVAVQGELTIGEYQGKPQFDIRANEVEPMSKGGGGQSGNGSRGAPHQPPADDMDEDYVPFGTCDPAYEPVMYRPWRI
jgi:single-strand DNA-binding protein